MENQRFNQAAWDNANQEIYDLRREVTRLTLLEKDYIAEMEIMQTKHLNDQEELQRKFGGLEEEKRTVEQAKRKIIWDLEQEVVLKCNEVHALKTQLESALKSKPVVDNSTELEALKSKTQELEKENKKLMEENDKMKSCIEKFEKDIFAYEETINNLKEDCNSLTENYNCKVEDLREAKDMVEILQEELMVTKTELEMSKSKPNESSSQGNSLFAEVDEKRLQLQIKMKKMKDHYKDMKQQIGRLEDQVFKMRVENVELKQSWEKEIEQRANDKYDVEKGYKERIDSLESLIKDYKDHLESRPIISTKALKQEELAFIEYRIAQKDGEIKKLLSKIDDNSFSNLVLTLRSKEMTKEANTWHLKYMNAKEDLEKKQEVITKLEEKIREMELATTEVVTTPSPSFIGKSLKSCMTESIPFNRDSYIDFSRLKKRSCSLLQENKEVLATLEQSDKENQGGISNIKKKVQFTQETKENECKEKHRRGGKTIICQPVVLKKREF